MIVDVLFGIINSCRDEYARGGLNKRVIIVGELLTARLQMFFLVETSAPTIRPVFSTFADYG